MPTSYTPLLGLALPATGELAGTWGTTVNDSITELVEDSIAATATASVTSGNWTLSTTGSGAVNQARCAVLIPTGTPGVSRDIIAPSQSKAYIVINQSDAAVVLKGALTTGTTIAASTKALCAWNGSDFVMVATADIANLSGTLSVANGGTGQTTYTNGQLLIGNTTGNTLTKSTLTAGSGISITNGSGSITIAATGGGGTVTSVTASSPLASSGGTTPDISLTGTVGVGNGGTGQTSYTNGQLLIGNTTGNTLTKATLTASTGITVTNGTGSISLAANYTEAVVSLAASGSIALSTASGTIQTCTLSGNPTFTDSLSSGQSLVLMLANGSSYTVSYPTITWVSPTGNVAPTLTTKDTLVFWKISTTLYGAYVGSYT